MSILLQTDNPKTIGIIKSAEEVAPVRRWERFAVDLSFKAFFMKGGMPLTLYGRGSDVSEGGMAAYIASELPVGLVLELELTLPYTGGQKPLSVKATVKNKVGFRYGLQYSSLQDVDRESLLRALRALSLTQ